jgi:hypothetical protein
MKETWEEKCKRLNHNMFLCWTYESGESMGFDYYTLSNETIPN